jgi:hypothetical protein
MQVINYVIQCLTRYRTPRRIIFVEKSRFARLIKKFPNFTELGNSLPFSRNPEISAFTGID